MTRSIALAALLHSIDSNSVELVLWGPCRRPAHSIKKELPLDPVSLTLYPPKHLVPNDAPQKVLSLGSSQFSSALFMMRENSAVCATKPRMCLISFRAHSHQRVPNLASRATTKEMSKRVQRDKNNKLPMSSRTPRSHGCSGSSFGSGGQWCKH